MNNGFYVFRFTLSLDRDKVLLEGLHPLEDTILTIGPWAPSFRPFTEIFAFGCELAPLARFATSIVDSGGWN